LSKPEQKGYGLKGHGNAYVLLSSSAVIAQQFNDFLPQFFSIIKMRFFSVNRQGHGCVSGSASASGSASGSGSGSENENESGSKC